MIGPRRFVRSIAGKYFPELTRRPHSPIVRSLHSSFTSTPARPATTTTTTTTTTATPFAMNDCSRILRSKIAYKEPETENLVEFLRNGLTRNHDKVIVVDSESNRTWTGRELACATSHVAKYLIEQCQLKKGDVCTVYGKPNDCSVILILSIISAGGVSNFLTQKYRPREVLDTSKVLKTKFLLSSCELLQTVRGELKEIESNLQVISCDRVCDGFTNGCKLIDDFCTNKHSASADGFSLEQLAEKINIKPFEDFAVIQFSSGTTGKPKPIPRTHLNLCHLVASVDHEELMDLRPGQVIAGSLSISHRPGLWALLACIKGGSAFVLWDNLSDVLDALKLIERYRVTIFSSSLPFLSMLGNLGIKSKDQFDLKSLRQVITSGAKIVNDDLARAIVSEFKLETLRQCFGMTESGWVFIIESSLAKSSGKYLTVGHAVPGMEVVVMDHETCNPLGPNERGELALRSSQIFPGYLIPDQSDVFNRSDFIQGNWFRTGDQAYYDEQELVYIEGRYKELLIFENNGRFFPNEIETVISEHPAVEGVCVVKVGESKKQHTYDIARAFVTLKQGSSLTEKELIEFVSKRSYEITLEGGVKFVDKFPRLTNGKVDKQQLKSLS